MTVRLVAGGTMIRIVYWESKARYLSISHPSRASRARVVLTIEHLDRWSVADGVLGMLIFVFAGCQSFHSCLVHWAPVFWISWFEVPFCMAICYLLRYCNIGKFEERAGVEVSGNEGGMVTTYNLQHTIL